MSSIIFLLILIWIIRKAKPDRIKSDFGKAIGIFFGIVFFFGIMSELSFLFPLVVIIAAIVFASKKIFDDDDLEKEFKKAKKRWEKACRSKGRDYDDDYKEYKDKKKKDDEKYDKKYDKKYEEKKSDKYKEVKSSILPRPTTKRTRIIRNFNEKYALSLTESEMQRIVDASYMSNAWKRELEAMTAKYETIYEYFQGPTSWLRVYIHAFHIQSITSDFEMQERIAFDALDEVFAYVQTLEGLTIPEMILRVNERFFASFDDVTFMIAYRFLQEKGRHYELGKVKVVQNEDSDMEDLMKKYEQQ